MGWVTLDDGQHIWIGPKGKVQPKGPGSKTEALIAKAKEAYARGSPLSFGPGGFRSMNLALRKQAKVTDVKVMQGAIRAMDAATKEHTFTQETTVYRGMDIKAFRGIDPKKLVGLTVPSSAYLSTSTERGTADLPDFNRGVMLKIKIPKGATAASIGNEGASLDYSREREFVFPRGSRLKITKASNIGENEHDVKTTLIHAELVTAKAKPTIVPTGTKTEELVKRIRSRKQGKP